MIHYEFEYLHKTDLEKILPVIFEILYSNMTLIAPTNHTYEEDYQLWRPYIDYELQSEDRKIVLLYAEQSIAGYFRYALCEDNCTLVMEDCQISSQFQSTGLLSGLIRWLIARLPQTIVRVEANSHKNNFKSQAVLEHLGLVKIGENRTGNAFRYQGDYSYLLKKYGQSL